MELFYLHHEDKEKEVKNKRQWIHDHQMQQQVLQSLHDDPAGGCHSVGRVQLPRVKVFDSLYLSLPTMAKAQIASLL